MRNLFYAAFLFCISAFVFAAEPPKIGDGVFETQFDSENPLAGWRGVDAKYAKTDSQHVVISVPDGQKNARILMPLDPNKISGTRLKITASIKSDNVAQPPNSYNGVKCMLHSVSPSGHLWQQKNDVYGTFDWKTVDFLASVPFGTTEAELVLGIENTTGTAYFDSIQIKIMGVQRRAPSQKAKTAPENGLRLRGAMIQPNSFKEADLDVLAGKWKANHVRWQLLWGGFPNGPADTATIEEYNAWLEKQLAQLDAMLPLCEKYGVHVVLDVHTPPGGRFKRESGSEMRLFQDAAFQDAFVANWEKMTVRYKDQPAVWGYDLLNEPVEGVIPENKGILHWRELALKTSKLIRKIDPAKPIIMEPAPWGAVDSLNWLEPFDPIEVPNVVYSVHMYTPGSFTHQGVYDNKMGIAYPGLIEGKHWDKEQLRKALEPAISFQRDYGVPIYLGEFSAIRWAPGESAFVYLRDCIEIFEECGWHWAYHAFREWDGWSVEHSGDKNDRKRAAEPTDRELLLRKAFGAVR